MKDEIIYWRVYHFGGSDLYARGYSEAPQVSYDPNLYITQLALLLQYIHWSNVNVVGMSMVCRLPFSGFRSSELLYRGEQSLQHSLLCFLI